MTAKYSDLVERAEEELAAEEQTLATAEIKERLVEIRGAKTVLAKLEAQYQDLLETPVGDRWEDLG
jgi:hypothetical protein